jgi:dTDP-glucose 4,6-dehydratase
MSDDADPTNIGNPAEMTVLQFAEEIKRLTGSNAPIKFLPLPEDDPKVRRPDITKARTLLNWEPKVRFKELVKIMVEHDLALAKREAQIASLPAESKSPFA